MLENIIKKAIEENKKVYIYAHKFPDGDAISSSCAVVEYLKNNGVEAQYVISNPIYSYSQVVGPIPTSSNVDKNCISLILDTNTIAYAENKFFKSSLPSDTYVIDHHMKNDGVDCIEDELNIPSKNVLRNSDASSVCEILVDEMRQGITPAIADKLTLGLMTDTARLKFLKQDTLINLGILINSGADFDKISSICNRKSRLMDEIGLAQVFLNAQRIQIGDTFGIVLPVDNKTVVDMNSKYGLRAIQKKIFKMADIKNCSFNCMMAENSPGEFDLEFRSTPIYGNFNVHELAVLYGGGGHYGASGCHLSKNDDYNQDNIISMISERTNEMYSEQGRNLETIKQTENDELLAKIFERTDKLSKGITPKVLSVVSKLRDNGANYDYLLKNFRTFEEFMLQNEMLSRVKISNPQNKRPIANISLSPQDMELLVKQYNVTEDQVLNTISVFTNIDIESASISMTSGKKSQIDKKGNILLQTDSFKDNIKISR